MSYFLEMEAHSQGNKVILTFKDDVSSALRNKCDVDADSDAVHLARTTKIVRREMFKMKMDLMVHLMPDVKRSLYQCHF